MKIKEHINEFKNSDIIQGVTNKISPTWQVIKNAGGYKILIISMLIAAVFMPIKALISFLSKILLGGTGLLTLSSLPNIIESIIGGYYYFDAGNLIMVIALSLVSGMLSLIAFIFTTFIVSNANFRAFKVLSKEDRVVSVSEYFNLAFIDLLQYVWKFLINVTLPIFIVRVVCNIINFIPYIKGISLGNLLISILTYALMFRFFAMMLELEHDRVMHDFAAYWLTFAIIVYLVSIVINLGLIITFLQMVFVLYTVLLLTESKYYYGQQ